MNKCRARTFHIGSWVLQSVTHLDSIRRCVSHRVRILPTGAVAGSSSTAHPTSRVSVPLLSSCSDTLLHPLQIIGTRHFFSSIGTLCSCDASFYTWTPKLTKRLNPGSSVHSGRINRSFVSVEATCRIWCGDNLLIIRTAFCILQWRSERTRGRSNGTTCEPLRSGSRSGLAGVIVGKLGFRCLTALAKHRVPLQFRCWHKD